MHEFANHIAPENAKTYFQVDFAYFRSTFTDNMSDAAVAAQPASAHVEPAAPSSTPAQNVPAPAASAQAAQPAQPAAAQTAAAPASADQKAPPKPVDAGVQKGLTTSSDTRRVFQTKSLSACSSREAPVR